MTDQTVLWESTFGAWVDEDEGRSPSGWPHSASRTVDIAGPVHYLHFPGPSEGPVLLCVHGLGGSALNWGAVAPLLSHRAHVYAVDLIGHGYSHSRSGPDVIEDNLRLLETFITGVCRRPVGQDDPMAPVDAARNFAANRSDWALRIVSDTGHLPHLENPDWTAHHLEEWLSS
ncbi:MAG TPA: alpha/beta fold hydrolase [Propionibacteriaceae bacterium]|nr:alpha/beta fold hydrolase [Propionibacteriaceae bacterium]